MYLSVFDPLPSLRHSSVQKMHEKKNFQWIQISNVAISGSRVRFWSWYKFQSKLSKLFRSLCRITAPENDGAAALSFFVFPSFALFLKISPTNIIYKKSNSLDHWASLSRPNLWCTAHISLTVVWFYAASYNYPDQNPFCLRIGGIRWLKSQLNGL